MKATYIVQDIGGIKFRLDIIGDRHISYTTNGEGEGLFYHDGRGGRNQTRGTSQFSARTLAEFKCKTRELVQAIEREQG